MSCPVETFQGLTFGENGILDMSQNQLQDLPPKLFDGLKLNRLYLQNNDLSQLHAEIFPGLTFGGYDSILDISQNKLQELPPKLFDGLKLNRLYLQTMTCLSCMQIPFVVSPLVGTVPIASWTFRRTSCRTCLQSSLTV